MLGHVGFQFFRVSTRGGLPARLLGGAIEVVREVFRVGVADFPGCGEAGVGLGLPWDGVSALHRRGRTAGEMMVESCVLTIMRGRTE